MSAKRLPLLVVAIALAGCAATGPRYADHIGAFPDVPPHLTRLTVFRTAESTQYSGRSATVRIDGGIAPFAAMGAESAGSKCGGAFSIFEVDERIARRKLGDLRLSR